MENKSMYPVVFFVMQQVTGVVQQVPGVVQQVPGVVQQVPGVVQRVPGEKASKPIKFEKASRPT